MLSIYDKINAFLNLMFMKKSHEPESVSIEITTYCNYSCEMCYRHAFDIKDIHINRNIFDLINNQLPKNIKKISLSGLGEGLMNPDLPEYLRLCKEKHPVAKLDFTTNGYMLDQKRRYEIINTPVDMVTFSLDSISVPIPPMGHKASNRVIENIRGFAEETKDRNISLRLQSVVFSKDQIAELLTFSEEIGFDVINLIRMDTPTDTNYIRLPIQDFRSIFRQSRKWGRKRGIPVVSSGFHNLPMMIASHFDKICLQYHNFLYITVDGEVLPCCVLRHYSFGNVTKSTINNIWKSPDTSNFFFKQKNLCNNCDIWRHNYSH
jgi:MoaA/NifB/PqqE/SkfB family radical SAM enzyme